MNILLILTLIFQIAILFILTIATLILFRSVINGAIYFPTEPKNVSVMVSLLAVKPGEKIADLGSGDGRVVIALARAGAEAHGYEINPLLVYQARKKIRRAGLKSKAFIHYQSFWKADLSKFDAIAVYGFPNFFKRLGLKIKKEMRPDARIVSNLFKFPDWHPSKTESGVYLYLLPQKT